MRSARFVPVARREFLAEVVYYNQEQAGLALASPPQSKRQRPARWPSLMPDPRLRGIPGGCCSRAFPSPSSTVRLRPASSSLPWHISHGAQTTGQHGFRTANQSFQPTRRGLRPRCAAEFSRYVPFPRVVVCGTL